jgi:hypothetical protein
VFEIHSFIGTLHPHLGKFPPLELAIDEHLLPPILETLIPNNEIEWSEGYEKKKQAIITKQSNEEDSHGEEIERRR